MPREMPTSILLGLQSCMPSSLSSQRFKSASLDANDSKTQACIQKTCRALACISAGAIRVGPTALQRRCGFRTLAGTALIGITPAHTPNHQCLAEAPARRLATGALSLHALAYGLLINALEPPLGASAGVISGLPWGLVARPRAPLSPPASGRSSGCRDPAAGAHRAGCRRSGAGPGQSASAGRPIRRAPG